MLKLPNGLWLDDSVILQNEAQHFFKNIFCSNQQGHNHSFFKGNHPTIDEIGKNAFTSPITKVEVAAALNFMKPYKAPGPDDFQCIFLK